MSRNNQKQLSYKINFYAVGQGLFSSGHITLDNDEYSQKVYLEKEMAREISKGIKEALEKGFSRDIIKDIARSMSSYFINKNRLYEKERDSRLYGRNIYDYIEKFVRPLTLNNAKRIGRKILEYGYNDLNYYGYKKVKKFHFVYDCGTLSPEKLITKQIDNEFRKNMNGSDIIDLLTISHFDKDHISGLDYLFKEYKVETILLPFIDLPHRLFLAFYYKVDIQSEFMGFFINPTQYLLKKYEGKIEQIILVPPSNDNSRKDDIPIDLESIQIKSLKFSAINMERKSGIPIFTLAPKDSLLIENIFQFTPYNDASISPALTPLFISEVEQQKKEILDKSGSSSDFASTIKVIKKLYDKEFGKSGKKRNIISLFLFASPLNYSPKVIEACQYDDKSGIEKDKDFSFFPMTKKRHKNAILYTGDGYLDDKTRLKNLRDHLGEKKFQKIACLQVMHHGAKSCWYEGLAKDINPYMSIFSANSTDKRYNHPHAVVVRDFLTYSPILVDTENSFFVNFY